MQRFVFTSIIFFTCLLFPIRSKLSSVIDFYFDFLSTLSICFTAAFVIATLNIAHCWTTFSASLKTSNYFILNSLTDTFLEGSGWILIKKKNKAWCQPRMRASFPRLFLSLYSEIIMCNL